MNMRHRFFFCVLSFVLLGLCGTSQAEEKGFFASLSESLVGKKTEKILTVDLFDQDAPAPSACSVDQQVLNEYSNFIGHVNACVDLMNDNPEIISFYESKKCLVEIGSRFKAISSQDCKDTMLTGTPGNLEEINQFVLDGYFDNLVLHTEGPTTTFRWDNGLEKNDAGYIPYVEDYFSLVGTWFQQTRGELYKNTGGKLVVSQAQSDFIEVFILKKFWDALQAHSLEWADTFGQISTLAQTDTVQTEKLFEIFNTLLTINQKVIDYAYESELAAEIYDWVDNDSNPGPSPVLAAVIGDSLAPFYERIRTLTKIYDIACKLNSCDDEFYQLNETVWMLRFFNQMGQGEIIDEFQFEAGDERPLVLFLKSLYAGRGPNKKLIAKMNNVFGVANIANIQPGTDFPHFLESFHKVFAESHDFVASYEATKEVREDGTVKAGFFHGGNVSEINVGFGKANMSQHIEAVTTVNQKLTALSDSFVGQHNQLINETLSINSSLILLSELEDKINIDVTDMMNLKNQIDAIRQFIHQQKIRFGKKVQQIIANLGSSSETFVPVGSSTVTVAAASSSHEGNGTWDSIGKIALNFPAAVVKGDLLRISVSGEYQPTCAISKVYGSSVAQARTGSRGFNLSFVNGKSKVDSTNNYRTRESFSSNTTTVNICSGLPPIIAGAIGISTTVCNSRAFGSRNSRGATTSDSSSASTRSDASFDLGLTMKDTPYRTSPAGALLLVEMPSGETDPYQFASMRVLNSDNSIIAEADSSATDYYLVVNDCFNPSGVGSLNVTVNQYRAAGSLASEFINKVTAMIPEIESVVAGLIENGVLSQQTLSSLRGEWAGSAVGGISLDSFNGNIRILLEAFLDSEMNILNYKSQITNMERELEMKKQALNSLVEHYGEEEAQKFLKVSQRNWNLANMDLDFVNTEGTNKNLYTLNRVIDILEHNLVSYLDFKYDEERKRSVVGNVGLLTQLNFASPFDEIALNITTFMTTLLDNLQDDINNRPVTPNMMMGIHVPNPYYQKPVGFPDPVYDFAKMDSFRAKQLWDSIYAWKRGEQGGEIDFDILFADLYTPGGLGCYVEAPIIESMVMYFVPENEGFISDFNSMYSHLNAKMRLEGVSQIPFENNAREYNFVNPDWRFMDVGVRMAKSPRDAMLQLKTEFPPNAPTETGLSTGRSPFGYFRLGDIPAYKYNSASDTSTLGETPLDEIKELYIAYTFAASNNDFDVNLSWLKDYCGEEGSYWKWLSSRGWQPGEEQYMTRFAH